PPLHSTYTLLLFFELPSTTLFSTLSLHDALPILLVAAQFGAFFHNELNEKGESYMLYTLSGVPRETLAQFPLPRNTALFSATFRDRKSTRLNSSHVAISYAVFCLKKKNTK